VTERNLRDQDDIKPLVQCMKRLYNTDIRKMIQYKKEEVLAKREGRTIIKPALHKVKRVYTLIKCT